MIATNETRTVREFVETAFAQAGIEIAWEGSGVDEIGKRQSNRKSFSQSKSKILPSGRGRAFDRRSEKKQRQHLAGNVRSHFRN